MDFSDWVSTLTVFSSISSIRNERNDVENSTLSQELKDKANKTYQQLWWCIGISIFVMTTTFLVIALVGALFFTDYPLQVTLIAIGTFFVEMMIMGIIIFQIFNKLKREPEYQEYINLRDKGLLGKSKENRERLKPSEIEARLIKKYQNKKTLSIVIFILGVIVGSLIWAFLLRNSIMLGVLVIGTIFFYLKFDEYSVEIHRLTSGYFKEDIVQRCQHCGTEIHIPFNQIEQYVDLPKDEQGYRNINCPTCTKVTQLITFDSKYKAYQEYLEQINHLL